MAIVRDIFIEYQEFLGVDLCFQGFAEELETLPGKYAPPLGEIFFATDQDAISGIVALRPIEVAGRNLCEMKRLFVRPRWRGQGLGRVLAETVVDFAKSAGYEAMVLDTVEHLEAARAMYAKMGFEETAPYYENPLPRVVYMEKEL